MINNIDTNSHYTQLTGRSAYSGSRIALNFAFSQVLQAAATVEIETEPAERTVDDVKREFNEYLDSLVLSPGLVGTSISVNITEAAFEKMLADPEYMQKMKDLCARDLCDPRWTKMAAQGIAPSGSVINIDADCEEEYLASSFNSSADRNKANRDDFWNRRKERHKEILEQHLEWAAEKREFMDFLLGRSSDRRRMLQSGIASPETVSVYPTKPVAAATIDTTALLMGQ